MREAAPAVLPHPWLTIDPLYPGGYVPPMGLASTAAGVPGQAAAARLAMEWPGARCAAEHAAAAALEAGSSDGEADALVELAGVALLAGNADEAETLYRRVQEGEAGRGQRSRAMLGLAVAAGVRGDCGTALVGIGAAEELGGILADADLAVLLANRAAALMGLGRLREAEHAAAEALRAGRRMKDDYVAAIGGFAAALANLARGRRNEARTRLAESVRAFARTGDVLRQLQCHHLLGEIAYDGEDPIRAGAHYRDGLGLARTAGVLASVELLTLRFEHR